MSRPQLASITVTVSILKLVRSPSESHEGVLSQPCGFAGKPDSGSTQARSEVAMVSSRSSSGKARGERSREQLLLLGFSDRGWTVLEEVAVRSLPSGLVAFQLTQHWDRWGAGSSTSSVQFHISPEIHCRGAQDGLLG